jgi:hypothetical protein
MMLNDDTTQRGLQTKRAAALTILALAGFGALVGAGQVQAVPKSTEGNANSNQPPAATHSGSTNTQSTQSSPNAPDDRNSRMGSQADPSTNTVHEGSEKTASDGHKKRVPGNHREKNSDGAMGFNNGLYSTGTGSSN